MGKNEGRLSLAAISGLAAAFILLGAPSAPACGPGSSCGGGSSCQGAMAGSGGGLIDYSRTCKDFDALPMSILQPADLPQAEAPGARLFSGICSQCHALPDPKRRSAAGWELIVERMDANMAKAADKSLPARGNGRVVRTMSQGEKENIAEYLRANAYKVLRGPARPAGASAGYRAYEARCSQCHQAPDPSNFPAGKWPGVVEKMGDLVKRAAIAPVGAEEKDLILEFLKEPSVEENRPMAQASAARLD